METMEQARSRRVLVTGGTGFVGSHLVELLIRKGYPPVCLVRDPKRTRWLAGMDVEMIAGDCRDRSSLERAVRGVSFVIHAAGLTKARHSRDYYDVNHLGTRNILEACARHNPAIRKFVLLSSLAAAGPSRNGQPVRERDAPQPVSDYGRSKLKAEEEVLRFKDTFPVSILRPSAVYGPRDRDMFELFLWASRGFTLEIAGGDRTISPVYVKDVASAILASVEKETPKGRIYFVADSRPWDWAGFREVLLRTGGVRARNVVIPEEAAYLLGLISEFGSLFTGRPALLNRQKVREAVQRSWVCDTGSAEQELGFFPAYSLEQGLQMTWQWYRENNWLR
jgi:nucleoside-diphosphate-sugar epimerase